MKTIRYLGILLVCSLLLAAPLATAADSYFPTSIVIAQGTQISGDVGSLSTNDAVDLQVNEVNLGTELDRNPNQEWLVYGTREFGSFSACVQAKGDSAYCSYWEEDDGGGDPTGNSLLLTPTGPGTYTEWESQNPGTGAHWDKVDDDPPHDSATTMVMTTRVGDDDTYQMEDTMGIPVGQTIAGSLTTYAVCSVPVNGIATAEIDIELYQELMVTPMGPYVCPQGSWVNHSYEWTVNPLTGNPWTVSEINAMEVGVVAVMVTDRVDLTAVGAVVPLNFLNMVLDLRMNTTLPTGARYYNLTITANWDDGANPAVYVSVWDFELSDWVAQPALTITDAVGFNDYTEALTADEISPSGEVRLRFDDFQALGDLLSNNLSLDWVNVHATYLNYTATIDLWYSQVNVLPNTQGVLILTGYRDGDTEAITLQVFRGAGSWAQLGADIFTSSRTTETYPIDVADIVGSALLLRIADSDPTDDTQTEIYLDYAELIVKEQGGVGSPVFPDYEAEYDWWSGDLSLYDESFSLAGDITTWNWRVDGDYAGDNPEIHVEAYPNWWDIGQHKVEVRLEVTDEMGFAAVEFGYVWVDNSPRLIVLAAIFLLSALVLLLVASRIRLVERFRTHRQSVKFKTAKRKDHEKYEKNRIPRVR